MASPPPSRSPSNPPSRDTNLPMPSPQKAISITNAHITHLRRLQTSTPHLDALLALLAYTSKLLSLTTPLSVSPSLRLSLRALSTLLSDLRTSLRLFGLLGIYAYALSLRVSPPPDPIQRGIAWAQVVATAAFQVCENVAVLAEKGVLGGVGRERRRGLWLWSSRAWMVGVGLEIGRLGRGWVLQHQQRRGREVGGEVVVKKGEAEIEMEIAPTEKKEEGQEEQEQEKWWREVLVTAAYAPMTIHSSIEDGVLPEAWIGALGLLAAGIGFRQAWRETS